MAHRLRELDLGDASLVFGRIDTDEGDAFYIGRVAVSDEDREPVVVDWRAPVAEPFYRATGRVPMGLARRRHFATRGRTLLGIEDELFGDRPPARRRHPGQVLEERNGHITGHGALIAALETSRTGRLTDIVATIQGEQDEIIRSELPGMLVVQGGPGTGKTVVALHRAAYLLYTHRFPLEGQGVLVVGPNRLFLGYIEQVLPSLGEAGVEVAVLADLLTEPPSIRGFDTPVTARIKGDVRMAGIVGQGRARPTPAAAARCSRSATASRSCGSRPSRRSASSATPAAGPARTTAAASSSSRACSTPWPPAPTARSSPARSPTACATTRPCARRSSACGRCSRPAQLLHDLFGSKPLLRLAGGELLSEAEVDALHRPRSASTRRGRLHERRRAAARRGPRLCSARSPGGA